MKIPKNMMGLAVLRVWLVMMNRGYRGLVNVMVAREEVYMMGLAVLRAWLVIMNRGYRGLVNVIVAREVGEYDGLSSFEGVAGHDEQARG
jgi:hypothetical protein